MRASRSAWVESTSTTPETRSGCVRASAAPPDGRTTHPPVQPVRSAPNREVRLADRRPHSWRRRCRRLDHLGQARPLEQAYPWIVPLSEQPLHRRPHERRVAKSGDQNGRGLARSLTGEVVAAAGLNVDIPTTAPGKRWNRRRSRGTTGPKSETWTRRQRRDPGPWRFAASVWSAWVVWPIRQVLLKLITVRADPEMSISSSGAGAAANRRREPNESKTQGRSLCSCWSHDGWRWYCSSVVVSERQWVGTSKGAFCASLDHHSCHGCCRSVSGIYCR